MALTEDRKRTRWYFVAMVAVAIAISYFDRQTSAGRHLGHPTNHPAHRTSSSRSCRPAFLLAYARSMRSAAACSTCWARDADSC